MLRKNKGLVMADYIAENVERKLEGAVNCSGFIDALNNCREQGYILYLYDDKKYLTMYVYAHRNSDKPTITWEYAFGGQMYSEEDWIERTKSFDSVDDTVDAACEIIADYFGKVEGSWW